MVEGDCSWISHDTAACQLLMPCRWQRPAVSVQVSHVLDAGMQLLAKGDTGLTSLGLHHSTTCSATCKAMSLWLGKSRKHF